MRPRFDLSAYFVADLGLCGAGAVEGVAAAALRGGATMLQLRAKQADTAERTALARRLAPLARASGAAFVVNDDVEAAIASGADGAHIGQGDGDPSAARAQLGPNRLLGLSIETAAQARAVDPRLVDYAGAGPVFATATKTGHAAPVGLDGLAAIIRACPVPVVAIGGLTEAHAAAVIAAGALGVAVVSAIASAPDPSAAAAALAHAVAVARAARGAGVRHVLSVAGSDPSGGAGVQADLKTFSALGVYGMAAITALTAQNTTGVSAAHAAPADFVAEQIRMIRTDIRIDAVKIGMIATSAIAEAVADALAGLDAPIVLDPVMTAKGGAALLAPEAEASVRGALAPLATLITPNLPEAARLLGAPPATTRAEMPAVARALQSAGARAVLLKGGHLPNAADSPDLLLGEDGVETWLDGARRPTRNTHGTGCTLSAALAAELAKGAALVDAAGAAKAYVSAAIAAADRLSVGHGRGPTHHFHAWW